MFSFRALSEICMTTADFIADAPLDNPFGYCSRDSVRDALTDGFWQLGAFCYVR